VAELERAPGRRGRGRHALKEEDGADLHLFGSTELVQTLLEHDLVDELRLMIDRWWWVAGSGSSALSVRATSYGSSRARSRAPVRSSPPTHARTAKGRTGRRWRTSSPACTPQRPLQRLRSVEEQVAPLTPRRRSGSVAIAAEQPLGTLRPRS
jgi:hypothetical protein